MGTTNYIAGNTLSQPTMTLKGKPQHKGSKTWSFKALKKSFRLKIDDSERVQSFKSKS